MFQDLKPYPEYKDADLPWLETLPSHWAAARGKTLFTRMERPIREGDGVVTCFRDGRVMLRSRRRTTGFTESLKEIGYQGIRRGDLVIHAMDAFAGAVGVAEDDGKSTPVYAACVPRGDASTRYYAHLVRRLALSGWIQANARGVRERSTDYRWASFAEERLPTPPREEQEAIVTYLAHAHQRINKAITTKRRMLRLLGEQEEAIVRETVGRGPQGGALRDSGLGWLGPVPESWGVVALRYLARLGNGSTPSRANSAYWTGGSYPWLNSSVVNQGIVRHVDQFVTDRALTECHLPIVPPGSVLIGITGQGRTRGMAALLESEATINQHLAYMTPFPEKLRSDYLFLVFKAAYTELRRISDSGSTKGALTVADLKAFRIPLPPLDEQRLIVMDAERQVATTRSLGSRVEQEIQLLEEFRTRLTADIVTGQLDVRAIAATLPPIVLPDVFATSADTGDADDDETADGADMEDE